MSVPDCYFEVLVLLVVFFRDYVFYLTQTMMQTFCIPNKAALVCVNFSLINKSTDSYTCCVNNYVFQY
jgi:hypothetical protein